MKVLGVIPARYESTRFRGKALADLVGKPMIQHVYERASKAKKLDSLIVATDDQRIFDVVKGFGGEVAMTVEHPTGTNRVGEIAERSDVDVLLNIQGDEPLIEPAMIDEVVVPLLEDSSIDLSTLVHRIGSEAEYFSPNVVKVILNRSGLAMYFSRSPVPYIKSGGWRETATTYRHVGLYAYRRQVLLDFVKMPPATFEVLEGLEQLRFLENGYKMKVVETTYESVGVDTPEDLVRVRKIMLDT